MKRLTAMTGTYPRTRALKEHTVTSSAVELDFAPVEVAQRGFKAAVRELAYDVTELALMTFLVAYDAGKPLVLLPFAMNGGHHHKSILCRAGSVLTAEQLPGKTVAMRSYSQTTPTWVRGILADEYGVNVRDVRWLTQEGAHVEEYEDPAWVTRSSDGSLEDLLRTGKADAIIAGSGITGDDIRPLIPAPQAAAAAWEQRTGVVPINHMVAIRREVAEDAETVREVFRMLRESRAVAGEPERSGFGELRPALELGVRYAHEQQLIRKRYDVEELYGAARAALAG
ncbi:phosphate/phosphite/phosphonate ABC transporter substrate-binding protein [Amycolatopsis acidicola]|uniref:Phosphate/phosphite/phosphonate ABC transporter substrate-binding protein n=1 Tax=Amycolatopsis acidicola TaxID=2596893 RepID=A0A5N0ULM4_9PSEU|nr:phosphate/phosphite/phosphonate ABC transporter substrate-binding protein [Amycolatopsis acidicola]KAA9150509.1 phosphate/phosphite/phosphonate ABC transporter substrate-binding protein [Amycolatopsis acidicola]